MIINYEKKWVTEAGYPALIVLTGNMNNKRWLCGYVIIPDTHIAANNNRVTWEKCPLSTISVHGGITFNCHSDSCKNNKDMGDSFLIGFDCGHHGDTPEECDVPYCILNCESLAEQLLFLEKNRTIFEKLKRYGDRITTIEHRLSKMHDKKLNLLKKVEQ